MSCSQLLARRVIAGLLLGALSQTAGAIAFNFSQTGYSGGATVTGTFSGVDADSDGALNAFLGEITGYTMSFSGNASVSAFTHGLADLGGLVYVLGTPFLGDDPILGTEGIASGPPFGPLVPFTYASGLGPTGGLGGTVVDNTTGASDLTLTPVSVTPAVPGPATAALLGLGFAAFGLVRRRTT